MSVNSRIARINFTGFASGSIASFTGLRAALIKIRAYIDLGDSSIKIINMNDSSNATYFKGLLTGTYGFVDLGEQSWDYDTSKHRFFCNAPSDCVSASAMGVSNASCSKYINATGQQIAFDNETIDKCFILRSTYVGSNRLYIRDTSYTDAQTFKTAMSGVYLIYELATATIPTITSEQFNALLTAFDIVCWYKDIDIDYPHGNFIDINTETQMIGSNSIFSDKGNVEVYYVTI